MKSQAGTVAIDPHPNAMERGGSRRARSTVEARRWTAVLARDVSAGFVYSVASTGVYCRPACPSRRPLQRNVAFHETPLAAELAGFRPCKRCRPHEQASRVSKEAARPIALMCQLLEESERSPSLSELAEHVDLSESHAHRLFVKATGLTPKRYRDALVRRRVHENLSASPSVTAAIYATGFSAPSRFYEHVARSLGMSPGQYRAGAHGVTMHVAVRSCSLGAILVAATERGVCALFLGDDPEALRQDLKRRFPKASVTDGNRAFETLVTRTIRVVDGRPGAAMNALPLDIQGTVFQQRVWQALREIPRGKTKSYREVATAIGAPSSSRAVARACADNHIGVLVPCHRVLRADGSLSGYRWGVERKRELLRRERR